MLRSFSSFSKSTFLSDQLSPSSVEEITEILAISSRPNFDAINYKNYDIETLNRNLPIWATYEPGSTFNIVAANDKYCI